MKIEIKTEEWLIFWCNILYATTQTTIQREVLAEQVKFPLEHRMLRKYETPSPASIIDS